MNRALVSLFSIAVLTLAPLDSSVHAQGRRGSLVSPEVRDGKVTFRLLAPNAKKVELLGQWPDGRVPMVMEEQGVWETTVSDIPGGVWEYSFSLDGVRMIDPANRAIKPMRNPRTSILHIPSEPPALYDLQDVPHGTVHQHTYHSKALGRPRELVVYTPPEYGKHPEERFPTLYLQHGSGDNEATWTVHGKAHWILDNLIAQKKAVPMVVVMIDGHAVSQNGPREQNTALFEKDLLQDVLPFVEASYAVRADPDSRAIVGLSMGGGQSLTIGLDHTDIFHWVGGFSSSVPSSETVGDALSNSARTNERLKLLWIACGKDDFLLKRNEAFIAALKEKGIKHEWLLTEGNHSWPIWRGYLGDFVPLLFQ